MLYIRMKPYSHERHVPLARNKGRLLEISDDFVFFLRVWTNRAGVHQTGRFHRCGPTCTLPWDTLPIWSIVTVVDSKAMLNYRLCCSAVSWLSIGSGHPSSSEHTTWNWYANQLIISPIKRNGLFLSGAWLLIIKFMLQIVVKVIDLNMNSVGI